MLFVIVWLILGFIVLELAVLMKIGAILGVINTLVLLFVSGVVGTFLVRIQGFLILQRIQENLDRGLMPTAQMLDGLMVFGAGALFIFPGFVSDVLGFLLLFPLTRVLIRLLLQSQLKKTMQSGRSIRIMSFRRMNESGDGDDVIDI